MANPVLEAIESRAEEISALGPSNEKLCRLDDRAAAALRESGVVRMLQPKTYQGFEQHPREFAETVMAADTRPANKAELLGLFEHLERELDEASFLRPPEKRPGMIRSIRNMFQRAGMTEQEVRTIRGIVTALTKHARRRALEEFESKKSGK